MSLPAPPSLAPTASIQIHKTLLTPLGNTNDATAIWTDKTVSPWMESMPPKTSPTNTSLETPPVLPSIRNHHPHPLQRGLSVLLPSSSVERINWNELTESVDLIIFALIQWRIASTNMLVNQPTRAAQAQAGSCSQQSIVLVHQCPWVPQECPY